MNISCSTKDWIDANCFVLIRRQTRALSWYIVLSAFSCKCVNLKIALSVNRSVQYAVRVHIEFLFFLFTRFYMTCREKDFKREKLSVGWMHKYWRIKSSRSRSLCVYASLCRGAIYCRIHKFLFILCVATRKLQ